MKRGLSIGLMAVVLAVAAPASLVAQEPVDPATLERLWSIADRLDCPVCQGQSVRESNAELALQMRDLILSKLLAGESDGRIFEFFAERYGEGILREPPKTGLALAVWLGPLVAIALGALVVATVLTRNRGRAAVPGDADLRQYESMVDDLRQNSGDDPKP